MGYYANGAGRIILKEKLPAEIEASLDDAFEGVDYDRMNDLVIDVWRDDKYYEDDVTLALNRIAKYTESGEIIFNGEDGSNWRFLFRDGEWEEENGSVIYDSDVLNGSLIDDLYRLFADPKGSAEPAAPPRAEVAAAIQKALRLAGK